MNQFILTFQGSTYLLAKEPADWVNCKLKFMRSEIFNSVLRSVTTPIRFVKDDKDYLLGIYENYGFEAIVGFKAYLENPITLNPELFFEGELDLSTSVIDRDFFECDIIENSEIARLIANADVDINIKSEKNIIGETVVDANVYKLPLSLGAGAIKNWQNVMFNGYKNENYYATYSNPSKSYNLKVNYSQIPVSSDTYTSPKLFENNLGDTKNCEFRLKFPYKLKFRVTGDSNILGLNYNVDLEIVRFDSLGVEIPGGQIIKHNSNVLQPNTWFEINPYINQIYTLSFDDGDYFELNVNASFEVLFNNNTVNQYKVDFETEILSTEKSIVSVIVKDYPSYNIEVENAESLMKRLVKRIIKNNVVFSMPALEQDSGTILSRDKLRNFVYFSGNDIRLSGISNNVKISEFIKALNTIYPIGIFYNSYNSELYVDSISEFYKNYQILTLTNVTEFKRSIAEDKIFNVIKSGVDNSGGYDIVNSRVEQNGETEFLIQLNKIKNTLELKSEFRTDYYGILQKIVEYYETDKTQKKEMDSDMFMVSIDEYSVFGYAFIEHALNSNYEIFTNNFRLSPKRCILANGHNFSYLEKLEQNVIQFIKSECYINFETRMFGEQNSIFEQNNIELSEIEDKFLYLPEYYEFNCPIDANILQQLKQNPHGYITFEYENQTYKGYIIDVEINLNDFNGKWKLIKHYER